MTDARRPTLRQLLDAQTPEERAASVARGRAMLDEALARSREREGQERVDMLVGSRPKGR